MREVVFGRRYVVSPRSDQSIEEVDVIQQGRVFRLTARGGCAGMLGKATPVLGNLKLAEPSAKDT